MTRREDLIEATTDILVHAEKVETAPVLEIIFDVFDKHGHPGLFGVAWLLAGVVNRVTTPATMGLIVAKWQAEKSPQDPDPADVAAFVAGRAVDDQLACINAFHTAGDPVELVLALSAIAGGLTARLRDDGV